MKPVYFAVVTALALGACNRSDTNREGAVANSATIDVGNNDLENTMAAVPPAMPGDAGVTTDPTAYVTKAGASDLFELESSRSVLNKTKNADVRRFAQMMVDNHQSSTSMVKQAAEADKVTLSPPVLQADQQTMLDDIKSADAASVDRIYLQHQRTAHTAALALHQGFAQAQTAGKLKAAAEQITGVVQKHLRELDRIEASVIGGGR